MQTLTAGEGGIASALGGVYFIAFSANDRIVTISDSVRVWDVATGKELSAISASDALGSMALAGSEGGVALTPDGTQLARLSSDPENQVSFSTSQPAEYYAR